MLDKVIATASILALIAFMMIVTTFVKELDLLLVVLGCLGIAIHDFVTTLRRNSRKGAK